MSRKESLHQQSKLILIVDDDPDVQEFLHLALIKDGYRIAHALDGDDAMEKAAALHPDLVLMDMVFPVRGGHETLIRMQGRNHERVPVIAMSALCRDRETREAVLSEPNVSHFIEKPVNIRRLRSLIRSLLGISTNNSGTMSTESR